MASNSCTEQEGGVTCSFLLHNTTFPVYTSSYQHPKTSCQANCSLCFETQLSVPVTLATHGRLTWNGTELEGGLF